VHDVTIPTRKCSRCQRTKPLAPDFIGKKEGIVTKVCVDCREQIDGRKAQALRLHSAMRELFAEAVK
jgi:hypothetical protein